MKVSNCPTLNRRVLATVRAGHSTYPEILAAMQLPIEKRTLTFLSKAVSFYVGRGELRRTYHNLGSVRTVTVAPADRGEGRDD